MNSGGLSSYSSSVHVRLTPAWSIHGEDQAGGMSSLCVGHLLEEPLQVLTGVSMDGYKAAIFI